MKNTILSVATAALLMTTSAFALFGSGGEATEMTQIQNNIQLAAQYAKQLQQYEVQLKSMISMTQNIGQLNPAAWNKFSQDFQNIQKIVEASQGLTYAAKDYQNKFENMHRGYANLLNSKNFSPSAIYQKLSEETRQTVKDNLKKLNMTQAEWNDDQATMDSLREMSASKTGQLQAIQAASEIALHQTQTLKKLHQTMLMSVNTQSQWMAAQQTKEDVSKALKHKFSSSQNYDQEGKSMYRQLSGAQ